VTFPAASCRVSLRFVAQATTLHTCASHQRCATVFSGGVVASHFRKADAICLLGEHSGFFYEVICSVFFSEFPLVIIPK
jgi:hypothetical protein